MQKNRTSITERLKKSRNPVFRRQQAHEWADKWEDEYLYLLGKIKDAANNGDTDDLAEIFADLRALQQPKFVALHNIIDELISPTREQMED